MAYATTHTTLAPASGRSLSTLFADLVARYERHRKFRQTVLELQSLSDRELADLGMTRSMIRRIALEAVSEH